MPGRILRCARFARNVVQMSVNSVASAAMPTSLRLRRWRPRGRFGCIGDRVGWSHCASGPVCRGETSRLAKLPERAEFDGNRSDGGGGGLEAAAADRRRRMCAQFRRQDRPPSDSAAGLLSQFLPHFYRNRSRLAQASMVCRDWRTPWPLPLARRRPRQSRQFLRSEDHSWRGGKTSDDMDA
jgi:hypothetical protein